MVHEYFLGVLLVFYFFSIFIILFIIFFLSKAEFPPYSQPQGSDISFAREEKPFIFYKSSFVEARPR